MDIYIIASWWMVREGDGEGEGGGRKFRFENGHSSGNCWLMHILLDLFFFFCVCSKTDNRQQQQKANIFTECRCYGWLKAHPYCSL